MTNLKLARGSGETWTFSVTDGGAAFDLTGWDVDLFDVPAAPLGLVTAVIGNAAAGKVTLRVGPVRPAFVPRPA